MSIFRKNTEDVAKRYTELKNSKNPDPDLLDLARWVMKDSIIEWLQSQPQECKAYFAALRDRDLKFNRLGV